MVSVVRMCGRDGSKAPDAIVVSGALHFSNVDLGEVLWLLGEVLWLIALHLLFLGTKGFQTQNLLAFMANRYHKSRNVCVLNGVLSYTGREAVA
jgi:hypothetical protein